MRSPSVNHWLRPARSAHLNARQSLQMEGSSCSNVSLTRTEGWDGLLQYMVDFHRQVPGGHFVTEQFIAHHSKSVARWTMRNGLGAVIGDGVSYGEYDDEGRLTSMTGFFETPEN